MADLLEIKSKFDADFRRVSIDLSQPQSYEQLRDLLGHLHGLHDIAFVIQYIDPKDGALLPISNDLNYKHAVNSVKGGNTDHVGRLPRGNSRPLKLWLQRKGESFGELAGFGVIAKGHKKIADSYPQLLPSTNSAPRRIQMLNDFRSVSSVIDVDLVPPTYRRVRLRYTGEKALGFHIRDGVSMRVTPEGVEKVPGIFISRLVPNGLAASTGLLAVNDEIVEVNGIEVRDKTLDQVSDIMVANSANLIITVKPVNQSNSIQPSFTTTSSTNTLSMHSSSASVSGGGLQPSSSHDMLRQSPSWHGSPRSSTGPRAQPAPPFSASSSSHSQHKNHAALSQQVSQSNSTRSDDVTTPMNRNNGLITF